MTEKTGARIGTVLEGKYTLLRLLGRGGMAEVYEAQHLALGRRVAIKLLLPELVAREDVTRRFQDEARAAGGLEHENIAAVYDVGAAPSGEPFLVMERLEGADCAQYLRAHGPLDLRDAFEIVAQACRGMEVAHAAGIIHRDLKPANLFLADRGQGAPLVKVLDFGIARLRSLLGQDAASVAAAHPALSGCAGTPHYMAPEQVRGDPGLDERVDVYALGVVLFELLTDRKPHAGASAMEIADHILHGAPLTLSSVRGDLPEWTSTVIQRAMAPAPEQRFQSVVELRLALTARIASARSTAGTEGQRGPLDPTLPSEPEDLFPAPNRPAHVSQTPPARPPSHVVRASPRTVAFLVASGLLGGSLSVARLRHSPAGTAGQETEAASARTKTVPRVFERSNVRPNTHSTASAIGVPHGAPSSTAGRSEESRAPAASDNATRGQARREPKQRQQGAPFSTKSHRHRPDRTASSPPAARADASARPILDRRGDAGSFPDALEIDPHNPYGKP